MPLHVSLLFSVHIVFNGVVFVGEMKNINHVSFLLIPLLYPPPPHLPLDFFFLSRPGLFITMSGPLLVASQSSCLPQFHTNSLHAASDTSRGPREAMLGWEKSTF